MSNKVLNLGEVWFECYDFGDVSLNYIEHSPDPWYSDTETDVSISREEAQKIIEFLKEAYEI